MGEKKQEKMSISMIKALGKTAIQILLSTMWLACSYAQDKPVPLSVQVLADSMEQAPKPMLMLISTDWCNYCQLQKAQLKKYGHLAEAMKQSYYVELNAETKDTLRFNGNTYTYVGNGPSSGINELAVALGSDHGDLAYPTWVLLDSSYQVIFRHQGLLNEKLAEAISEYVFNR